MRKLIKLTPKQLDELNDIFTNMEYHGAIAAQIFKDGMHVVLLNNTKARKLEKALHGVNKDIIVHSAYKAYQYGTEQDKR